MTDHSTPAAATTPRPQVGLLTILWAYFVIALTAFGMAILQKLKKVVLSNYWLTEPRWRRILAQEGAQGRVVVAGIRHQPRLAVAGSVQRGLDR